MGITGLLPLLKSIHKPCNLTKFKGLTIGVDAYGWLHRGTVACAVDLALDKPTTKFVDFAMTRVRMLIHFGVTPYLIFDGDYLPSKAATEIERSKRRAESRRVGLEFLRVGRAAQAQTELQKAVDVTPEMARQFIEELKRSKVEYLVAPYEADAQLAYLERKGIIQGILSEDSDLLVFGAKRLLTKLDQYGDCVEINRNDFAACRAVSLVGWSDKEFRQMAILSGCDYLANITSMGLKTAYRLVRKYKDIDKILRMLSLEGKYHVPPGYLEDFNKAELTFLHQRVFCPVEKKLVLATELQPQQPEPADLSFVGKDLEASISSGVARGDLHPMTKKPIMLRQASSPSPWPLKRAQTVQTPSDLKGNKMTIEAFFKSKRTPLAELDPNIFTPSPSQQRLLGQHNGSVVTTPVDPRQIIPRPGNGSASGPPRMVAPLGLNRTISNLAGAPRSEPYPSKRQRLCENTPAKAKDVKNTHIETGRSRFFAANNLEPSPSVKRNVQKRTTSTAVNIWSDDSIEDALLSLPDVWDNVGQMSSKVTASKVTVFRDHENGKTSAFGDNGSTSDVPLTSQTSELMSPDTPASSVSSLPSQTLADRIDTQVRTQLSNMRQQTPYPSPLPAKSANPTLFRRETALKRMGREALQRSQSSPSVVESPAPLSSVRSAGKVVAEPKVQACARPVGSEDCLVPDSEDECEDLLKMPKLDLKRFAFSG